MSEATKIEAIKSVSSLADFFEVDFKLSIFGHTILEWHYPPRKNA